MDTTFTTSCLLSSAPNPFRKKVPLGANYFLLELTPFQEKGLTRLTELSPKIAFIPHNFTLLLLNTTSPVLANSVDPDLDLHCLSLNI